MKKYENLKKVELHCHLDGSLNPTRVAKWTRKNVVDVEGLLKPKRNRNLTSYLEGFAYPISLMQTKTRLKEAAEQLCSDMQKEFIIYAEIRFDPLSHTSKGLSLSEIVDAVLDGMKASGLKSKLILCMKRERSLEENKLVIDTARDYLKKGVGAVDLAGDETLYPIKDYKELFKYAKEQGVPFVIHAGEVTDSKSIDTAISLGASRIGHGIKAITSFETMESLKRKHIPLEICISSNVDTGVYDKYSDSPVSRLIDSGVEVIIGTDNRTLSSTTLTDEYNILNRVFGLNIKDFNEMNRIAIRHAFLSDKEKLELLREIK